MAIDTADEVNSVFPEAGDTPGLPSEGEQWEAFCGNVTLRAKEKNARVVFGDAAKQGGVYRWGLAAATGAPCDALVECLSRLACGARSGNQRAKSLDLVASAEALVDLIHHAPVLGPVEGAHAILWAAAMPALTQRVSRPHWWRLLTALQQLRESVLQRSNQCAPTHLMLGGELGLTLAWRLADLPACRRLQASSIESVGAWCKCEDESISAALEQGTDARLVLASLIRCQRVIGHLTKSKRLKRQQKMGDALATWVAAMTTHRGGTAFSAAQRKAVVDDLPPHGLLSHAAEFDPETLDPAISAALGATQTGGRLAWQVSLPEAIHHDPNAKVAVLLPDWDVRRGRTHIDYSADEVRLEVFAGRTEVIAGNWQTLIESDGLEQSPCGDWGEVCEYSDDDVHYLEIEQPWTGGILLQRQVMQLREDRCLLLADAVLPSEESDLTPHSIKYSSRFPLAPSVQVNAERDTRDVSFDDGHRRGLVLPLSAGEWRVGPTGASLDQTADHHLLFSAQGNGRLYAPLWFDFQQRRFNRKRTWRQLTVADQLRIVGHEEAVAYRVQVGSEHWMLYRSLAEHRSRTFLGKHLIADFFSSRFDPGDGSHDELLTVDDSKSIDE